MSQFLFSGEPLPVAPVLSDKNPDRAELEHFHRNLLDHIRRLELRLSSSESQSAPVNPVLNVFSAFLDADLTLTAGAGFSSLDWDTLIRADTGVFSHSTSSSQDEITVLVDGFYLFICQIGSATDAYVGGTSELNMRLSETTKGVLDYGDAMSRIHADTLSLIVGVNADANDIFTIDVSAVGTDYTVDNVKTNLMIFYCRADIGSDHGTGAGKQPTGSKGFKLIPRFHT